MNEKDFLNWCKEEICKYTLCDWSGEDCAFGYSTI